MRKFRQIEQRQSSLEKWALVFVLLLLLFWKRLPEFWKDFKCSCEDVPAGKDENVIDLPKDWPTGNGDLLAMNSKSVQIDKELYERQNDQNVLNLEESAITKQFFPDTDTLKITQNAISS